MHRHRPTDRPQEPRGDVCPTFVCNAENDPISSTAPELVAALTCPKELVTFTAAEGAGDHCESGARLLYHARSFGLLETVMG